jgi:hypothetical protein
VVSIGSGFWLQYASQNADDLVALADDLAADGYRPGVVFAPVGNPQRLAQLYGRARAAGEAFLDPAGFQLDRESAPQRARNFPWLDPSYGRPTDVAAWIAWMEASLEHQLSDGFLRGADEPTILVTPSPQLTASTGTAELYAVIDAAAGARDSTAQGRECWLGVVVDREYLRIDARLTELADAVVTADFPGVMFRCFQSELTPISDRRLLDGLRELVEGCAGADVEIFLPNGGWVGWLAGAWGASGYSGGLSKGSWFDRMPTPMRNPGRRESIFEPQLLRHVQWGLHEQLVDEDGYDECDCASCTTMGGDYDADEAKVHQIRVAHAWSHVLRPLNAIGRRRAIRARIDDAIAFRDDLPRTLRDRADAAFLDTWRSLV